MSNRTIYDTLRAAGLTAEGACGLMGNMAAKSTMKSNIAQRGMTHMSDEDYTAAADNGVIDFARDSVGYGLCQWTYYTRKAALLAFCKSRGVSVGDEQAQVEFCLQELQREYPMLLLDLRSSHDMYQLTADVCTKYERPADNNISVRYEYALQFWNDFCGSGALAAEHAEQTAAAVIQGYGGDANTQPQANTDAGIKAAVMVLQMVMSYAGYWGAVTGDRSPEFFDALAVFVEDLKKS